jgi:6-pyruvoyltetrahydropterin/6-carboxytetrahydropterin synthase
MMVYVTRKERFSAAHRLFNPSWTDLQNEEVFGGCSNPNWHGHNYLLEVTVAGIPDKDTGFVINLKILKEIIAREILVHVDHKNINIETPFMKGVIPSSENLAIGIWNQLKDKINGGELYSIKLSETENNYFEYKGE